METWSMQGRRVSSLFMENVEKMEAAHPLQPAKEHRNPSTKAPP